MIDHLSIGVTDFERAKTFYAAALAPLGYTEQMSSPQGVGYGADGKPSFWFGPVSEKPATGGGTHIAFAAPGRKAVDAFYAAAMAAGGTDNGAPGLRPHYHPGYYAAFVIDPDGHRLEAVCHKPE